MNDLLSIQLLPGQYVAIGRCSKTDYPGGDPLEIWGHGWLPYNKAMHVGEYVAICPMFGPETWWPPLRLNGSSMKELVLRIQLYLDAPKNILPCKTCYDKRHAPAAPTQVEEVETYLYLLHEHESKYKDSPRSNADWLLIPDRRINGHVLKCLGCGDTRPAL